MDNRNRNNDRDFIQNFLFPLVIIKNLIKQFRKKK